MRHTYSIEVQYLDGRWCAVYGLGQVSKGCAEGYLLGSKATPPPRLARRIVRSDGKIVEEHAASAEVSIGMIAGWPRPEQYEAAAQRALDTAREIRESQPFQRKLTMLKKLTLIPKLDACAFSPDVFDELADCNINTHYQADDVHLQWEVEDDFPMLKTWLLETYGDEVKNYTMYAISPT